MDGYLGPSGGVGDGGASKYGLPVRVDQALPSDHLASAVLNWPAVVSARIGGDMDCQNTWSQMGSTGAFLSALQIRPIMDVLWTQSVMPDNTEHLPFRKYIDHELVIALLTCGPVGFGDSLPNEGFLGTNVTKLLQTSRSDGVLLKPAHPALRLDVAPPNTGGPPRAGFEALEVWAAAAVPSRPSVAGYARTGAAGLLSAATDRRANSLARLQHVNGSADVAERWWYTLLATDVNSKRTFAPGNSTTATITPEMLFPVPPVGLDFVVSTFGNACRHGDAVQSCLRAFTPSSPLPVETDPCPGGKPGCRNWKLLSVAPVLAGGWAIVGEESKYVALSPQRIVAAHTTVDSTDPDASDALLESELIVGPALAFTIIGAMNETVAITVVAPGPAAGAGRAMDGLAMAMAGKIVVVKTTLGASGEAAVSCSAGACVLTASYAQTFPKPGSAGAGYVSKKLRKPKWQPTFGMRESTAIMPCNYSGFYNLPSLADYGWIQFDWSNRKDLWCQDKPMTASETISTQAQLAHAALPSAKIGVYRSGIKAINLFAEVREKLDDPAYSGWFVKYNDYPSGGYSKNHTYFAGPCTYPNGHEGPPLQANASGKCSPYYHEQTQVPQHHTKLSGPPHYDNGVCIDECDCGKLPCGNYVFDHRNDSFSKWYVSADGPIISNRTILAPGVVAYYLDDSAWIKGFKQGGGTGGITEADTHFLNDTGITYPEWQGFHTAYEKNMETLYDNIVAHGGYAWQMNQDGPGISYVNPKGQSMDPGVCASKLRTYWCQEAKQGYNIPEQSGVFYGVQRADANDDTKMEQKLGEFLLTRGNWSWIGYDWNGCHRESDYYPPQPPQWSEDFGVPLEMCHEVPNLNASNHTPTGVFKRRWSKATVTWDCEARSGVVDRG